MAAHLLHGENKAPGMYMAGSTKESGVRFRNPPTFRTQRGKTMEPFLFLLHSYPAQMNPENSDRCDGPLRTTSCWMPNREGEAGLSVDSALEYLFSADLWQGDRTP